MLNRKDKEEFIRDGHSINRRRYFAEAKNLRHRASAPLDEYIRFLMGIQSLFSVFSNIRKKTVTRLNKL